MTEFPYKVEQLKAVGQITAVRAFDPKNEADMDRLLKIIQSTEVQQWMDEVEGMELKDVKHWSRQRGKGRQEECLFAVSGSPGYVSRDEVGEVQAFVNTYRVDEDDKKKLIEKGLVDANEDVFEVSYARNPKTKPGQVASGLIQVCFELNRMLGNTEGADEPSLPIVAFVPSENRNSWSILLRAGFERVGEKDGDGIYVLNWKRAQSVLHDAADKSLDEETV